MPKEAEILSTVSIQNNSGQWQAKGGATPFKITSGVAKQRNLPAANSHGCADHAEMRALTLVDAAQMNNVRLEQNAFPCEKCHPAMRAMSAAGSKITVVVTANKGAYNLCHKISGLTVLDDTLPLTIVYEAGHASYDGTPANLTDWSPYHQS
jgi:hypothetical protein